MRRFFAEPLPARRAWAESEFQGKHPQTYAPWDDDGMPAPGIGSKQWQKARLESV
jgi:hypothetical protein